MRQYCERKGDCTTFVRTSLILLLTAPILLAGCSATGPAVRGDEEYAAVRPQQPLPAEQNNGAIFQVAHAAPLFEDYKARRVGDILTVILQENTNAAKSASTSTAKESSVSIGAPTVFGKTHDRLGASVGGQRDTGGSGDSRQSNQLTGSITVTVAELLPNGNMVIQGEKWLRLNQGQEYVRLRGIVRPMDVSPTNTVVSTQIADAQISYGGTGAIADANAPGWLSRFFLSPLWPF